MFILCDDCGEIAHCVGAGFESCEHIYWCDFIVYCHRVYTSMAYRCSVLLKTVSRATSGQQNSATYYHIANFTLGVSLMYGIGHVCQSVMYLSSVFWPQFYAHNFYAFQFLFKWADMITSMASLIYVYRSVSTIKTKLLHVHESIADEIQQKKLEDLAPPYKNVVIIEESQCDSMSRC